MWLEIKLQYLNIFFSSMKIMPNHHNGIVLYDLLSLSIMLITDLLFQMFTLVSDVLRDTENVCTGSNIESSNMLILVQI